MILPNLIFVAYRYEPRSPITNRHERDEIGSGHCHYSPYIKAERPRTTYHQHHHHPTSCSDFPFQSSPTLSVIAISSRFVTAMLLLYQRKHIAQCPTWPVLPAILEHISALPRKAFPTELARFISPQPKWEKRVSYKYKRNIIKKWRDKPQSHATAAPVHKHPMASIAITPHRHLRGSRTHPRHLPLAKPSACWDTLTAGY